MPDILGTWNILESFIDEYRLGFVLVCRRLSWLSVFDIYDQIPDWMLI